MSLEWNREQGVSHIRLRGETGISVAAELKAALLELFATTEHQLTVDLSAVSDVHISIIQLVWAAANEARQRGIAFRIEQPEDERATAMLIELGLALPSDCGASCLQGCVA